MQRLKTVLLKTVLIPQHQFDFRSEHSTIDQVHRISAMAKKALEHFLRNIHSSKISPPETLKVAY